MPGSKLDYDTRVGGYSVDIASGRPDVLTVEGLGLGFFGSTTIELKFISPCAMPRAEWNNEAGFAFIGQSGAPFKKVGAEQHAMGVLRVFLAATCLLLTGCLQHVNQAIRPPKPIGTMETGKWVQLIARTDPEEHDGSRVVIFSDTDHDGRPVLRYAYEQCADRKAIIRDGRIYVIHTEDKDYSMYIVECD